MKKWCRLGKIIWCNFWLLSISTFYARISESDASNYEECMDFISIGNSDPLQRHSGKLSSPFIKSEQRSIHSIHTNKIRNEFFHSQNDTRICRNCGSFYLDFQYSHSYRWHHRSIHRKWTQYFFGHVTQILQTIQIDDRYQI